MTGSIAVSQCGYTPNRPGHHGTVVARTVGTVAISCNVEPQRHRHSMLAPRVCAPRVTRCSLGHVI